MKKRFLKALCVLSCIFSSAGFSQSPSFQTYMNPVIPGDHPDCTISRVGDDYYTTGSSFNPTPTIYHSTDLVHWEAISHPVSPSWSDYGDAPGGGCWGGHIVLYKGKYWDFFESSGLMFCVNAPKPEGPWSTPVKMICPTTLSGLGGDNSIFIDETDSAWYLVVKDHPLNNWLVQLGDNGQPEGKVLNLTWINPSPAFPYSWAEGPVMWRYNNYYYYCFARDLGGPQYIMRSKILTDDKTQWEPIQEFFESNNPLESTSRFSEPNHASNAMMINDSTSWVLHPLYAKGEWKGQGRQGLLNQVHYDKNGKPTADYPVDKAFTAPKLPSSGIPWMVPKSDFFTTNSLNPEWSFFGYVSNSQYSLTDRSGWLRLSPKSKKINPLTKNDGEHNYSLITKVDFTAKALADEAGLIIIRGDEQMAVKLYSSFNDVGRKVIDFSYNGKKYEVDNLIGNTLWLKMNRVNHIITGYYSKNGIDWTQVGSSFDVSIIDAYSDYTSFTGSRQGIYVNNSQAYFDLYIYRDAYSPILAECPANQLGTVRTLTTKGYSVLDSIHNNDWVLYAGVEFGNKEYRKAADSIQFTASSATNGGTVEIWLDSIQTGELIGTCEIANTGSWTTNKSFSAKIKKTTGRHDVYMRFIGNGTGTLFKIEWLTFISKNAPQYKQAYFTNDSTVFVKLDTKVLKPSLPSGFNITINGTVEDSITAIKYTNNDSTLLELHVFTPLKTTDKLKLLYNLGSVTSPEGLELFPFTDSTVNNLMSTSAPQIVWTQTSITGDSVIVQFNKKMKSPTAYLSQFKITTDLVDNQISDIKLKDGDSTTFIILVKQKIYYENINTLTYTGSSLMSTDNGIMPTISSLAIYNISIGMVPNVKIAAVRKVKNIYNTIAIKFDRPMANVSTQKSFFTININGKPATISAITGVSDSIRFTISPIIVGGDVVTVSYSGGTVSSSHNILLANFTDFVVSNPIPVSIDITESDNNAFIVFPNPNKTGVFTYTIDNSVICNNPNIEVVSSDGTIIYKQILAGNNGTINLNKVTSGCYYIHLHNDNSLITKSILIQ